MRALIDTSSLLFFVRAYLPFEKDGKLKKLLETKFNSGELIVLDKVYEEYKTTIRDLVSNLNAQVTCTNKCIVNMTDVLNNHTDTALIDLNNILSIFTVYQTTNGPLLAQKRALDESLALVEGKIASLINSNVSLEIKTRSD